MTNIRSLANKFDEISATISVLNSDIIALCETWLKPNLLSSNFLLNSYLLIRSDRLDRHGGGVCLWIKESRNPQPLVTESLAYDAGGIDLCISLVHRCPIIFAVVYLPPNLDADRIQKARD